ncbi:hypothetical protein J4423_05095 [Candidatus Pacearchaeota archaeon]|nr:hypothetical protein [Candidatus Pacearchaeota archaeon]
MKFRKGDAKALTSLIVGIIVAVGLIFIAVKLILFFMDQDARNARIFLDNLNGRIENLADGQSNTFALRGVQGWVLVAWNKEVPPDEKPQRCFDKNCLCICQGDVSKCQDTGYCKDIDRKVSVSSRLNYSPYDPENVDGLITSHCIPEINKLMGFLVDKKLGEISIYHDYGDQKQTAISGKNDVLTALSEGGKFLSRIRDENCNIKDDKTYGISLPGM